MPKSKREVAAGGADVLWKDVKECDTPRCDTHLKDLRLESQEFPFLRRRKSGLL